MTAKKTPDTGDNTGPETTGEGTTTSGPDGLGVVTSRNDNDSDPTGVNPAATWETSTTPSLAVDDNADPVAEVRYPIQCLAPMPCNCPKCIGTGTDDNTLSEEEAKDAADVPDETDTDTTDKTTDKKTAK